MATSGSKWICDTQVIIEHLKRHKGKVTHTAKTLGVAYETLRQRINEEPTIKELIPKLRNELDDHILDSAETCLSVAMSKIDEDTSNALKAAFFALNSKGKPRGYNNTLSVSDAALDKFDAYMNQLNKAQNQASGVSDGSISPSELMKD